MIMNTAKRRNGWPRRWCMATWTGLALLAGACCGCKSSGIGSNVIVGDGAHPTGRRWYPAGVGIESVEGTNNVQGLYLLTTGELLHLMEKTE